MKLSPLFGTYRAGTPRPSEQGGWQVVDSYGSPDLEREALQSGVGIVDFSANGKIMVEGQQAGVVIQKALEVDAVSLEVNVGVSSGPVGVYRLRRDMFLIHTEPGAEVDLIQTIRDVTPLPTRTEDLVTLTVNTHGRAEIAVIGPASRELLSRLCGLNFSETCFPNLTAKQSSLAKTNQIILRHDKALYPAFALIGDRSFGPYLWQTLLQAGRDLGIMGVGLQAIADLVSLSLSSTQ